MSLVIKKSLIEKICNKQFFCTILNDINFFITFLFNNLIEIKKDSHSIRETLGKKFRCFY